MTKLSPSTANPRIPKQEKPSAKLYEFPKGGRLGKIEGPSRTSLEAWTRFSSTMKFTASTKHATHKLTFPSYDEAMSMGVEPTPLASRLPTIHLAVIRLQRGALSDEGFRQIYASLLKGGMSESDIQSVFSNVDALPYDFRREEAFIMELGKLISGE